MALANGDFEGFSEKLFSATSSRVLQACEKSEKRIALINNLVTFLYYVCVLKNEFFK